MFKDRKSLVLITGAFVAGAAFALVGGAIASPNAASASLPSASSYLVSINEIKQTFVFGERFSGSYTKSVVMSDGTTRNITLVPAVKDGHTVVELIDPSSSGSSHTFMGPNGTTTNGALMVSLHAVPGG